MRLFDETDRIKHSPSLMQPKRIFCLLLSCGAPILADAQTWPIPLTNQPPATHQTAPAAATSGSSTETRNTRVITLEECIRLALEHNLDIQIQEYNPIINQLAVNVNFGVYEPVFSMKALKNYTDSTGGIDPTTQTRFGGSITEQDTYTPDISG